ncbi:DUF3817 domain-containing protein [Nocardioides acrostichi]|uniref:DUF3817 domain-containing protein n=1 Tax=Nocardioides acrostichi TaxID=2784339 RepID=A0A930UZM6_9ACTN|nr:DUF3817 domain-containing protein [Nocardioides acrostichi]MBF4162672.1 DUF3817 domain-containing protein [Nocardioides acrostichi]
MGPRPLFAKVALAEAITWGLLLIGMVLKYSGVTELGVRVFGMLHGIVFIAYVLTCLATGIDQRWRRGVLLAGVAASIPPFCTVWFDRWAERRDLLMPGWRLLDEEPARVAERPVAWLIDRPLRGLVVALLAVGALTALALVAGPPGS